jgi:hypothetical protein
MKPFSSKLSFIFRGPFEGLVFLLARIFLFAKHQSVTDTLPKVNKIHRTLQALVRPAFVPSSIRPSARPSVRPSFRSSIRQSVHVCDRQSVHCSVRPSIRPSLRPSLRPSIHAYSRQFSEQRSFKTRKSLRISGSGSIISIITTLSVTRASRICSHFWRPVIACSPVEIISCRVN